MFLEMYKNNKMSKTSYLVQHNFTTHIFLGLVVMGPNSEHFWSLLAQNKKIQCLKLVLKVHVSTLMLPRNVFSTNE